MIRTGASASILTGGAYGGVPGWKVYPTPRIVQIADSTLGPLRHALLFLIFTFIIGFHIMFRGSHLVSANVDGVVRLQLRDPSEGSCDEFDFRQNCSMGFRSLSSLPYCSQTNFTGIYQKPCEYWDSVELRQMTDEGMLIPTRVMSFHQKENCQPGANNQYSCKGMLYKFVNAKGQPTQDNKPEPVRDIFIADIENFEILFDHSAHAINRKAYVEEYDFQMAGTVTTCSDMSSGEDKKNGHMECEEQPIICVHDKCPKNSAKPQAQLQTTSRRMPKPRENEPNIENEFEIADKLLDDGHTAVSTHKGDILSINGLVKAAAVELDARVLHSSRETYRNDGVVLVVRIEYTNDSPWIGLKVLPWRPLGPTLRYTYRIMKHATGDISFRKVSFNRDSHDNGIVREVDEFRGIRVVVEQTGSLMMWDNIQLMFLVTTTLALLALTNCLLDHLAMNCMANSAEYRRLKYVSLKEPMTP